MMEPDEIAKLDQATALMTSTMPPYLRRMYLNCVAEGFTEEQSMRIILQFIANLRAST